MSLMLMKNIVFLKKLKHFAWTFSFFDKVLDIAHKKFFKNW